MTDIIVILVLISIIGVAAMYVYKAKKAGRKCIGCPYEKTCKSHQCNCNKDN